MIDAVADALMRSLDWEHERVQLVQDPETGLRAVIAIHSTVLGPALGGMRIRRYGQGMPEALDDALRLSRAMTLKAAAAGLDLGGGKAVILDDGDAARREARIVALAREIERLGGAYITAEDIGTTTADMDVVAEHTRFVVGRTPHDGRGGDPSPATARTVLDAMRTALDVLVGSDALEGLTVGVVGLGKVGGQLATWLLEAGAHVVGYDPVPATRWRMEEAGVQSVAELDELLATQLDVLAPCAVGGMIDEVLAARLRCRVVCGAANNPLADERAAATLAAREILYVPDFLANCGGLIHADWERRGEDPAGLAQALDEARTRTCAVLLEAYAGGGSPGVVAERRALDRIELARAGAPSAA